MPISPQKATRCGCGIAIGTQQTPAAHGIACTIFGRNPSTRVFAATVIRRAAVPPKVLRRNSAASGSVPSKTTPRRPGKSRAPPGSPLSPPTITQSIPERLSLLLAGTFHCVEDFGDVVLRHCLMEKAAHLS